MTRILIVGGYGAFGARIAERLCRSPDLDLIIAGRAIERARAAAIALGPTARAGLSTAAIDARQPDLGTLRTLGPTVVVNASGPFQTHNYALAESAIAVGAHYVDLADARDFVTGISALDARARAARVLVTSGASSVPALAAAIVDHHRGGFKTLTSICHGIIPGNRYDPGRATVASILGAVGQPIKMWIDGRWTTQYMWQGLRRINIPGLGGRLVAHCEVPDLELFPSRYRGVHTVRFLAGLEVAPFHLGVWGLSWLVRWRLLRGAARLAGPLLWVKRRLKALGSDSGGMFLHLSGNGLDGQARSVAVYLIARNNHGPYVPSIASVILARKLARGVVPVVGAMPCLGLMTLQEFIDEVADLEISIESA